MKQASGPVSKVRKADLPLLRTPIAIPQKLQEPSFSASVTVLQILLACLNFILLTEYLLC